jgi:glyoxylase-like metal-dependent hydrolase (beta-lactamase superfamily II)
MIFERAAAEDIHRVEDADTNWYLVEEAGRLTVVDTGLPRSWNSLQLALGELGRELRDIEAVVLTHGHFDHMGFAARAQRELSVPLYGPERERPVLAHPWRYDHEASRAPYLRNPTFAHTLAEMTAMGALWVKGSSEIAGYGPGAQLDAPGRPVAIATPGHTHGHCALHFPERGAVIVGDAFVTHDPYTGRIGPCIVAGAATADSAQALQSLDALAGLDAAVALTGHGPPWRGAMGEAVAHARAAGPA